MDLKIAKEIQYSNNNKESFYPREMYVSNNKLVVIGTYSAYLDAEGKTTSSESTSSMEIAAPSIYYMPTKTTTKAICYNISDKQNIKEERTVEIEGSYLSSRMIKDDIYLVSNKYVYSYGELDDLKEDDIKPMYRDTSVNSEYQKIGFDKMYYFPGSSATSYMLVAGFNVSNNNPVNIGTYLGAGNTIYSSEKNLYVVNTKYEYNSGLIDGIRDRIGIGMAQYEVNTEIFKFALNNGKISYKVKANVPGTVLNQFSMDEYKGNFRIATTDNSSWDSSGSSNNLYTLDENLNQLGKIEDLAKGERIYSVRFMGDKGYIVTFRQVDPLFVIDLADAKNPAVLGELKIPGYSDYLHPYDETHLIGFGQDTEIIKDYYGERAVTTGMKMALFDVSDTKNPKELYSIKIGDKGTYSELLNNHKALLFSKEKNIIAFPISINENISTNSIAYGNLKFQGAIIYGLDLSSGFTEKGRISHTDYSKANKDYWYDYNRQVERIIYIGDTLYTASRGLIKATDTDTMQEKGSVEIIIEQNNNVYPMPLR